MNVENSKIKQEIKIIISKIDNFYLRESSVANKRAFLGKKVIFYPIKEDLEQKYATLNYQQLDDNSLEKALYEIKELYQKVEDSITDFDNEERKIKIKNEINNLTDKLKQIEEELRNKEQEIEEKRLRNDAFLQKTIDEKEKIEREIKLLNNQIDEKEKEKINISLQIDANNSLRVFLQDIQPQYLHENESNHELPYITSILNKLAQIRKKILSKKIIIVDDSALLLNPVALIDLLKQFNEVIIPQLVVDILNFQKERGKLLNKDKAKQALSILEIVGSKISTLQTNEKEEVAKAVLELADNRAKQDSNNEVFILSENTNLSLQTPQDNIKILRIEELNRGWEATEEQQKVLDLKDGLHLVLAPPGSGKTEILAQRVFDAKNNDGYEDSDMICLTFTNRAAKGMKERVEKKYERNQIIIGNIHNYCIKFLFRNKLIPLNNSILVILQIRLR
jgi:hypothetical protein